MAEIGRHDDPPLPAGDRPLSGIGAARFADWSRGAGSAGLLRRTAPGRSFSLAAGLDRASAVVHSVEEPLTAGRDRVVSLARGVGRSGASASPVVSVVIPAYNPGDLILSTLESVFAQTFTDYEVIVVDNGSTDGLAERLAPCRDRIRFFRFEQNRRPGAARNAGIRVARGRYVALLDADDLWMPERLERVTAFLDAHQEIGFATTDAYALEGNRRTTRSFFATPLTAFHERDQDVHILRSNFLGNQMVFRRELFERFGPYDETTWCEDWDRHIELIVSGERAGFVREPLAFYRVKPGSLSSHLDLMAVESRKVLQKWIERPLRPAAARAARQALARYDWDLAKPDLFRRDRARTTRTLWRLARSGPWDIRLKALLWLVLPARLVGTLHRARGRYLLAHGGSFALDEARRALEAGDLRNARSHLAATTLFAYPMRTRLAAAAWLLLPPLRKRITPTLLARSPFGG